MNVYVMKDTNPETGVPRSRVYINRRDAIDDMKESLKRHSDVGLDEAVLAGDIQEWARLFEEMGVNTRHEM